MRIRWYKRNKIAYILAAMLMFSVLSSQNELPHIDTGQALSDAAFAQVTAPQAGEIFTGSLPREILPFWQQSQGVVQVREAGLRHKLRDYVLFAKTERICSAFWREEREDACEDLDTIHVTHETIISYIHNQDGEKDNRFYFCI